MVRIPPDQMSRWDLERELLRLRKSVELIDSLCVARGFEPRREAEKASREDQNFDFRALLRAARPDLQIFRMRPWWQRTIIRAIWRTQEVFGVEGWVPRRERAAVSNHSRGQWEEKSNPERVRRFLDELSLVSAKHGLWVENTPRGTRLVSADNGMGGYFAIAWQGRECQLEFDVYKSGSRPKGDGVIFGVAYARTGDADIQPEEAQTPSAAEHDLVRSTGAAQAAEF